MCCKYLYCRPTSTQVAWGSSATLAVGTFCKFWPLLNHHQRCNYYHSHLMATTRDNIAEMLNKCQDQLSNNFKADKCYGSSVWHVAKRTVQPTSFANASDHLHSPTFSKKTSPVQHGHVLKCKVLLRGKALSLVLFHFLLYILYLPKFHIFSPQIEILDSLRPV